LGGLNVQQHITVNQWNKLTTKQKEIIIAWWQPRTGDKYYYEKVHSTGYLQASLVYELAESKTRCIPLLSIGQMLAFLDEQQEVMVLHTGYHVAKASYGDLGLGSWQYTTHVARVSYGDLGLGSWQYTTGMETIVTALWETCKIVLSGMEAKEEKTNHDSDATPL
jgi:hypothetical protein